MQHNVSKVTDGAVTVTITADEKDINDVKRGVVNDLRKDVKADGFRPGKAPDNVVEKKLGAALQNEVLEAVINRMYGLVIDTAKLQTLENPKVNIKKYVPYTELEFEAIVEITPEIKVPDLKKIKVTTKPEKVTKKDIDEVFARLQKQTAEKKEVERKAKDGDEVWIDFEGFDKDGKEVSGASGKEYPLNLGSNTFIPGFEEGLVGVKKGDEKELKLTFPKDYHAKALAGSEITFMIKVLRVKEVVELSLDDKFAASVSPFKTMDELTADITSQLEEEKKAQAASSIREEILGKLVDAAKFEVPPKFLERVAAEIDKDFERELSHRNIDLEQYLKQQGQSREQFEKEKSDNARKRAKSSLLLGEIAKQENITVNNEELDANLEALKAQHGQNKEMQEALDTPEARREIAAQTMTEKTVDNIISVVTNSK